MPNAQRVIAVAMVLGSLGLAQQEPAKKSPPKTEYKINILNVCAPSTEEQGTLRAALLRLPARPLFAEDFEISRGRTSVSPQEVKLEGMGDATAEKMISNWVRIRRDFPSSAAYVATEYSMSVDEKGITETLVFRSRDVKDVIETTLEDSVSAGSTPAQVLRSDTPVDRIRIERFGKSSVVLARCPGADQSAYQPLFTQGSAIMAHYRALLKVRSTVPADLARLGVGAAGGAPTKKSAKK